MSIKDLLKQNFECLYIDSDILGIVVDFFNFHILIS